MPKQYYVPITPGGTVLWELRAKTEEKAFNNLLRDAPYPTKESLIKRGYTISVFKEKTP